MRQVPTYLIIGNGRVARHLRHYFLLLQLKVLNWQRPQPLAALFELTAQATHILVLISDHAIEEFIKNHLLDNDVLRIHCSGSLVTPHAFGAHPLFTFNDQYYDLQTYQSIPFVLDQNAPDFDYLLPGLPNQAVRLDVKLKAKYHALCVMSANFSCLLWQKLFNSFEQEFNLPAQLAQPLLLQQTQNLYQSPLQALTGPLTRDDGETISKNLASLALDPFQEVYQSFVDCYRKLNRKEADYEPIGFSQKEASR